MPAASTPSYKDIKIFYAEKFVTGTYGTSTVIRPTGDEAVLREFLSYDGSVTAFCEEKLTELQKDCQNVDCAVLEFEKSNGPSTSTVVFVIIGKSGVTVLRKDQNPNTDKKIGQVGLDAEPADIASAISALVPEITEYLPE